MNDKVYRDVEKLRSPERMQRLEIDRVMDVCLEGISARRVLDVGTGSGIFAQGFAERGLETAGIDPNGEMLGAAREWVKGVEFREAFAENIPYPDSSFDVVFLGLVLHETEKPDRVIRECRRVARQRAMVLEWPFEEQKIGPPIAHRLKGEYIEKIAFSAGFRMFETIPLATLVLYRLDM